jgi:hypothetical protein
MRVLFLDKFCNFKFVNAPIVTLRIALKTGMPR